MSAEVKVTEVTLSEKGLALVLLEDQLLKATHEVLRWQRRVLEATHEMKDAQQRHNRLLDAVAQIKESI